MKRLLILSPILIIIILYITVGGYSGSKPVSAYHSFSYDWECKDLDTGKTWICGTSYCDMHGDVQTRSQRCSETDKKPAICHTGNISCYSAGKTRYWGPPRESPVVQPKAPTLCTLRGGQNPTSCELPSYATHLCPPVTAGTFGLPNGNQQTSKYGVNRVFYTGADGKEHARTVPDGYIPDPAKGEKFTRKHLGDDFSSHSDPPKFNVKGKIIAQPEPFTAGVSGTVHIIPGSKYNTINVVLPDGSTIQYLHASHINVVEGQQISPDTELGITGNTGVTDIHLHVQAKDSQGRTIDPQRVIDKFNKQNNPGCQ